MRPDSRSQGQPSQGGITIDADDCFGVSDGNGAFGSIGLEGTYPANESVVLPAFISGGLFMWDDTWESFGTFAWVAVGQEGKAAPVFQVTAWC